MKGHQKIGKASHLHTPTSLQHAEAIDMTWFMRTSLHFSTKNRRESTRMEGRRIATPAESPSRIGASPIVACPSVLPQGPSPDHRRLPERLSRSSAAAAPNPPFVRPKHRLRAEMGGRSPRPCKASRTAGGDGIRTSGAPDNSHVPVAAQVGHTDDECPRSERQKELASGHTERSMPATADLDKIS